MRQCTSFAIDPDGCIADLQAVLARLGIEPTGEAWQAPIYTEFRTAAAARSETPESDISESLEGASSPPTEAESPVELPAVEHPSDSSIAPSDATEHEPVVGIGDRFALIYTDEPNRQLTLTMTASDHRPDVGLVAASHAIFKQFLGAAVDEQLSIMIDGKPREAVILAIDKMPPVRRVA